MTDTSTKRIARVLTFGTLVLLSAGAVLAGTSLISARNEGPGLPPREKTPRPDESRAVPLAAGRQSLAQNPDLRSVIQAVEEEDVDELLGLAKSGGDTYCASFREVPPECRSRDDTVPSVYQDSGTVAPRAVETMRTWLSELLEDGDPALEFASRDKTKPEGSGGQYFLFFRVDRPVRLTGDDFASSALGLVVTPGSPTPVDWFVFQGPEVNGLVWVQVLGGSEGASNHLLITPETVAKLPGLFGEVE
jgi:hypothetical protein